MRSATAAVDFTMIAAGAAFAVFATRKRFAQERLRDASRGR